MNKYSEAQQKVYAQQAAIRAALTPINGVVVPTVLYKLRDVWHYSPVTSLVGIAVIKTDPEAVVYDLTHLVGRQAKCAHCKRIESSSPNLAFFKFMGPGSPTATSICECGYGYPAHQFEPNRVNPEPVECRVGGFKPRGPSVYDEYYCGCRGWD